MYSCESGRRRRASTSPPIWSIVGKNTSKSAPGSRIRASASSRFSKLETS